MIAWLRNLLRAWLLADDDELCFRDFVYGLHDGIPISASCRRPRGHRGECSMGEK